jgi:Uma2 family endonuclease
MTTIAARPVAPVVEEPEPYTHEEFKELTQDYPDLRMELTKEGEVVITPPVKTLTGRRNADLTADLVIWNRIMRKGYVFDSSAAFILPSGAERSPDVSWVEASRWDALTDEQQEDFAPLCPDFVIELRSKSDRLSKLQEKMREYRDDGARLGWLIDPPSRRVEVYRPGREVEVLNDPASMSGDPELPGFTLDLTPIW